MIEPLDAATLPALFAPVDAPARADAADIGDRAGHSHEHGDGGSSRWWTATEFARGPWDPAHCHGGPVAAMLARSCERIGRTSDAASDPWQIARLTVELTRPVPVGSPMRITAEVERAGRKVSVVTASLRGADGVEVAKVRALRIRRADFALPDHPTAAPAMTSGPEAGRLAEMSWAVDSDVVAFHRDGAEHRVIDGSWDDPGPMSLWIRLTSVLVAGETPSGVQRAAAAADFGNGVSSAIDFERFLFINPDLTVHLARPPVGEWVGMVSHSRYGSDVRSTGAGFAESELYDADGRLGRSVQSLFVEQR